MSSPFGTDQPGGPPQVDSATLQQLLTAARGNPQALLAEAQKRGIDPQALSRAMEDPQIGGRLPRQMQAQLRQMQAPVKQAAEKAAEANNPFAMFAKFLGDLFSGRLFQGNGQQQPGAPEAPTSPRHALAPPQRSGRRVG